MTASTEMEESSMTPEQRLAYLLEVVETPSNRGRLTHSWVAENISLVAADLVYAEINKVSPPTALRFAAGDGIDTSAALWKQQAEAVAAAVPSIAMHLVTLRDFDKVQSPRWQIDGRPKAPTLESITAEIESEAARIDREARAEHFQLLRERWLRAYAAALRHLNEKESGTAKLPSFDSLIEHICTVN